MLYKNFKISVIFTSFAKLFPEHTWQANNCLCVCNILYLPPLQHFSELTVFCFLHFLCDLFKGVCERDREWWVNECHSMHVKVGGQLLRVNSSLLPCWHKVSLVSPGWVLQACWSTAFGLFCLCLLSCSKECWDADVHHYIWLIMWVPGMQLRWSCFSGKCFYPLNYHIGPWESLLTFITLDFCFKIQITAYIPNITSEMDSSNGFCVLLLGCWWDQTEMVLYPGPVRKGKVDRWEDKGRGTLRKVIYSL